MVHLVFAAYNFITAIFYWLDMNGVTFGFADPSLGTEINRALAADAQRLYVLAHAALAIGLGLARQLPRHIRFQLAPGLSYAGVLIGVSLGAVFLKLVFARLPGLSQFEVKMQTLSVVCAGVSVGTAMRTRSRWIFPALALNVLLFVISLASGWKEETIVLIILNAASFYPLFPRRTVAVASVLFVSGLVVLPTISGTIRDNVWSGQTDKVAGLRLAFRDLEVAQVEDLQRSTWTFLTNRFTEVGLFVRYLEDVPDPHPYYGLRLVEQAVLAPVPRIVWSGKPDLEVQVHQRVLRHGVVSEYSNVSAKPQYVVDGFLSAGGIGVFLAVALFGWAAQTCSSLCESYFSGYFFGGVVFNGLFAVFWRGNCFEFMANSVVWSVVLVFVLVQLGTFGGLLRRS